MAAGWKTELSVAERREAKKEKAWCVAGRVRGSGFGRPWPRERDYGEGLQPSGEKGKLS